MQMSLNSFSTTDGLIDNDDGREKIDVSQKVVMATESRIISIISPCIIRLSVPQIKVSS